MINSIFLNLRKNLSKTIILFVTMLIICNLIIAGFSLLNGWQDMLAKINTTYKNNVVITSAISKFNDTSLNITIDMMDSFKNLDYVDKYKDSKEFKTREAASVFMLQINGGNNK